MAHDNDVVDLIGIPEPYCEGLAKIEHLGPCRRLVFTVRDTAAGHGRVCVAKLILPAEALADIAQMLAADIHVPKSLASLSPNALAN
jgi:hypothetical protein